MSIIPDKIFDRLSWEDITDQQLQELAIDTIVCGVDPCGNLTANGVIIYLKENNGDIIAVHFLYVPDDVQELCIFMARIAKEEIK